MNITLIQIEYLLAVAQTRHFGQAARQVGVSQPSLSLQIQKLEEELGVILFDRSKKPILISEAGRKIIEQARVARQEVFRIEEIAKEGRAELSGSFHIAAIPTVNPYLTPLYMEALQDEAPKLDLSFSEWTTEQSVEALLRDDVDVAILATPLHDERLIERPLFVDSFELFVSEEHELFKKKHISMEELKSEDLWLLEEGHCLRKQAMAICMKKGRAGLSFRTGSLETLKNLVLRKGGLTILPRLATYHMPKSEEKFLRPFRGPVPSREISLVYSRSFLKEREIALLEDSILSILPETWTPKRGAFHKILRPI